MAYDWRYTTEIRNIATEKISQESLNEKGLAKNELGRG